MRTVKWNPFLSGAMMLLGGVLLWAGAARADISSTNPAAIVVFPKLVVDTSGGIDTVIQLTNTAPHPVNVRCFYVDANGHCGNSLTICDPGLPSAPSGTNPGAVLNHECVSPDYCIPDWVETDFALTLTPNQPIAWTVSAGLPALPLTAAQRPAPGGLFDAGKIPPAIEDPMIGELKCVEVGDGELPVASNDLIGEATIEHLGDLDGYNAIGIQATGVNNNDNTLVLGEEYNACPSSLILDHFFDDAVVGGYVDQTHAIAGPVRTNLTLVPCSEDFNTQLPIRTVVQFLVYNEFEQRFSTSRSMTCFSELALSDIDTRLGNVDGNDAASIFNVGMEGTLTGQTIIRGVADPTNTAGNGLLGVAEEYHFGGYSSAGYMLDMRGTRTQNDIILLPQASPGQ